MGISTAIIGAGVLGAGAGIIGGSMQAGAAEDAANMQSRSAANATALQRYEYDQSRQDAMPWLTAGQGAVNRLSTGLKPGGEFSQFTQKDFQADPGYAWRKQQGIDTLRAGAAATGMFGSGNMGTALVDYGQGLASQEYSAAYGRWQDQYNKVAGLAGMGQQQSQYLGGLGAQFGAQAGNNMLYSGNAQAAGAIGQANAYSGAISNMSNQAMSGLGMYMNYSNQQSLLNAFTGGGGYGGSGGLGYNNYAQNYGGTGDLGGMAINYPGFGSGAY